MIVTSFENGDSFCLWSHFIFFIASVGHTG